VRFLKFFLCICLLLFVAGSTLGDESIEREEELYQDMLNLHRSDSGRYLIWHECGKRVKDQEGRADQYTKAILASIDDVGRKTGVYVDPKIVRAILFRESSDNECSIGKQEINWLSENLGHAPDKDDVIKHVKKWKGAYSEAKKYCRGKGTDTTECRRDHVRKNNSHYLGIKGWDIGAAQYRWPTRALSNRSVITPFGKVVTKIELEHLMDYEVIIHMLVEDLAKNYTFCKENHKHAIHSKWGFHVRYLEPEEGYWAHHHVGRHRWSEKYYNHIQRHLKRMVKMKSISSGKLAVSTR